MAEEAEAEAVRGRTSRRPMSSERPASINEGDEVSEGETDELEC